jgi:hypothetical protein
MTDAPEELWCWNTELSWGGQGGGYARQLSPRPLSDHERLTGALYRRADLPPTDEQLAADPRVRALVEAAEIARGDIAKGFAALGYPTSMSDSLKRIDAALAVLTAQGGEP